MDYENLSRETLVEKIIANTSRGLEEINQLIEEKKQKFAGMISDNGAALMVAKELGVKLEEAKSVAKISELGEGMKDVSLKAKIVHVFPQKKFEKNGKKGVLQNMAVGDGTGEIRLTIWNDQVQEFEKQKIEKNDEIEIENCFVKTFNEKKQLSLGFGGTLKLLKKAAEKNTAKLSEITAGQNSVDVYATLERVFDERFFSSNNREGRLLPFELKDETTTMRCVAWNEAINEIKKAKQGEKIKIEGAYTKQGLNGTEINMGLLSRIIVEPDS